MATESISAEWSNWTAVLRNLMELPFLIFAFKYIRKRLDERKEICNRIGVKYYPCIIIVADIRKNAKDITQDSISPLMDVNVSLDKFHQEILRIPNNGSMEDIEISEIRKVFSSVAAECVCKIKDLIGTLDGMGKESWQDVCSSEVIGCANQILFQWDLLVKIMAHKCWMKKSTLEREYREKFNAE